MLQAVRQEAEESLRLAVGLARTDGDIREAQRLRYRVFAEELGAKVTGADRHLDRDELDAYCDHLLVRERGTGRVIGTYRMLPGPRALECDGFYADTEFDLSRLDPLRPDIVELGRACVEPAFRNGAVIWQLWGAVLRYALGCGARYLMGSASVGLASGGHVAASICRRAMDTRMVPEERRVTPRRAFPLGDFIQDLEVEMPGLLAGYLNLGAQVCGPPAWDPDFNTADLLLLLPLDLLNPRYKARLLRGA